MSALPPNPLGDWSEYYQATLEKPLHPLFKILEPHLPSSGKAVDLGCGVGHAVLWLAAKGWVVKAVDGNAEALQHLQNRAPENLRSRIQFQQSLLEDVQLEPLNYDLVIAAYSLFFVSTEPKLQALWNDIQRSLKPGGYFIGEFLGPNDDWADRLLTHSSAQVQSYLDGWKVIHIEEAEQDGMTSQNVPKHWHVFHVIAQKPE